MLKVIKDIKAKLQATSPYPPQSTDAFFPKNIQIGLGHGDLGKASGPGLHAYLKGVTKENSKGK